MIARIFGKVVASEVDGPGVRAVVHFAGCSLHCPGCFNQDLWAKTGPNVREVEVEDLADEILAISSRVTISGGEPLEQREALFALLRSLRTRADSVILFTGHTLSSVSEFCGLVDVVIDGPYDASKPETKWMRGSTNQRILVLSSRLTYAELKARNVQVLIIGESIVVTGFPTRDLIEDLEDSRGKG